MIRFSIPRKAISLVSISLAIFLLGALVRPQLGLGQDASEEPSQTSIEDLSEKELTILYTKTNLSMAELELQRALEMNKKRPLIPNLTVERLRSNLAVAKEQYRRAQGDEQVGPEKVHLRHAQERVRLARADLVAAKKLLEKNSISDWEYRRLNLNYDLARLNLALLQHPKGYMTLMDSMQRQLDRLGDEYLALEQRIAKLEGSQLNR